MAEDPTDNERGAEAEGQREERDGASPADMPFGEDDQTFVTKDVDVTPDERPTSEPKSVPPDEAQSVVPESIEPFNPAAVIVSTWLVLTALVAVGGVIETLPSTQVLLASALPPALVLTAVLVARVID